MPAASQIKNVTSVVSVDAVQDIVISPITTENGVTFLRSIKIYGGPSGTDGDPVFTLVLESDSAAQIYISAPVTDF